MHNARLKENSVLEEARQHLLFHHHYKAQGWITLAQKGEDGEWKQYHYQHHQLPCEIEKWQGKNIYYSQNTFYKPQRRIETIKQLRALYIDVDCYNLNYDPKWVVEKLKLEVFQEALPNPNIIIHSGRGLVFIWFIEPVPSQALPLWRAVQNYFFSQMEYVGADKKSGDPTRVFRVAGSINSHNEKEVVVEYIHDHRYVLREIQSEYLPELKSTKAKKSGCLSNVVHLYNIRSLHYARLLDLVKLAEIRNYDLKGNRELICFLYRYWSCCLTDDEDDSLTKMLEFNSNFVEPLAKNEVSRATISAEKAWKAKNSEKANEEAIAKGYPGAGYNVKNRTIIQWLNISEEEQRQLTTIISRDEKHRRKCERDKLAFRAKNGSTKREAYLEKQVEKTEDMLWKLKMAMQRYPRASNIKLAKILDVSESYIRKLKSKIEF